MVLFLGVKSIAIILSPKYILKKKPNVEIPQKRLVLRGEDLNTAIQKGCFSFRMQYQ